LFGKVRYLIKVCMRYFQRLKKVVFHDVKRRYIMSNRNIFRNIDDMRIHDFRHLLGFTMVNNGVALEFIGKALGHKKPSTTQKYSNMKAQMAKETVDSYLEILKK